MTDVTITQSLFLLLGSIVGFLVGYAFGAPSDKISKSKKGMIWNEDFGIWEDKK